MCVCVLLSPASFLAIASGKVMPDFRNNEAFASFIDTMTGGVPVKKRHGVYTILFERVEVRSVYPIVVGS